MLINTEKKVDKAKCSLIIFDDDFPICKVNYHNIF